MKLLKIGDGKAIVAEHVCAISETIDGGGTEIMMINSEPIFTHIKYSEVIKLLEES